MAWRSLWTIALIIISGATAKAESVSITLSAPVPCSTDSAQLAGMVMTRTKRAVVVQPQANPSRRFEVTVSQIWTGAIEHSRLDHFRADIVVDGVAADPIADPSCQEVIKATALIIALAIDPSADTAPLPAPKAEIPRVPDLSAEKTDRPQAVFETSQASSKTSPTTSAVPWWMETNAGFGVAVGPGASPMPTIAASAGLGRGRWSMQTGVITGQTTSMFSGGQLRFRWLSSQTALCGRVARYLYVGEGCLALEAGTLQTKAGQIINATSSARLWLAPGIVIRARRSVPELATGLSAVASFGLWAPVTRDVYIIQPGNIIHRTPILSATLELGVQWQWW
jgi:hypothetical protein